MKIEDKIDKRKNWKQNTLRCLLKCFSHKTCSNRSPVKLTYADSWLWKGTESIQTKRGEREGHLEWNSISQFTALQNFAHGGQPRCAQKVFSHGTITDFCYCFFSWSTASIYYPFSLHSIRQKFMFHRELSNLFNIAIFIDVRYVLYINLKSKIKKT